MRIIYEPEVPTCACNIKKCKHPHEYHSYDQDERFCLLCNNPKPDQKFYPKTAIYRHYKGGLYQVFTVVDVHKIDDEQELSGVKLFSASFSEEREAFAFIYISDTRLRARTRTSNHTGPHVVYYSFEKGVWWLRPLSMFLEAVEVDTEHGKDRVLRFTRTESTPQ